MGSTLEIGAGEHPHESYEIHADILPLPHIELICRLDALPFKDGGVTALRANHVLEHQSWELVGPTLSEWARVLAPGGRVDIGVPDAAYIAGQWVRGELGTEEANYWLLGGHSDRPAHRGVDERGVPRWIWNAHHTLFDAQSLRAALERSGFENVEIACYAVRNLRATGHRGRSVSSLIGETS